MTKKIEVLPDKTALVKRAGEVVLAQMRSSLEARGQCTIALSGGSTPKPLYEFLATQDLPWEKIYVFWGDERYVPPDDAQSNYRMAREAWLDKIDIRDGNIYPMPTMAGDPTADASTYESRLQEFFGLAPGDFPVFDIILLGLGDDGHTASLFPQTNALQVCDRVVTVGNKDGDPRITLTIPVINLARYVTFVVAGASKQTALDRIFAPEEDDLAYPARMVSPLEGELWWLLDEAAGSALSAQ
ncbi:MAG: 6-phosphogluconolactonase [Cyanobacteriota bacterium]|nr:6-phosphogluconolactonase [Cyanobacteriota bacterium]